MLFRIGEGGAVARNEPSESAPVVARLALGAFAVFGPAARSTSSRVLDFVGGVVLVAAALSAGACRRPSDGGAGSPVDLKGAYAHADSGITFPESAAGFVRTGARRYDSAGKDVGICYGRTVGGVRVVATIYVFPPARADTGSPTTPEAQFEQEIRELRAGKAGLREGRRTQAATTHAGRSVTVRTAEFEHRGQPPYGTNDQGISELLVSFRDGAWHVTYRVTVERRGRDAAWAAVDELAADLRLPATGLAVARPAVEGGPK